MDAPFADRFLSATGYSLPPIERAKAGKMDDLLTAGEVAALIAEGRPDMWGDADTMIERACYVGQLKARTVPGKPISDFVNAYGKDVYIIHRDDARRYFAALNMMPAEGSALRCWLDGKGADAGRAKRQNQRDKEDFQQLCLDHWKVSPMTGISTEGGVVEQFGGAYRHYTGGTLHKWAAEVASGHVKRGGRKKKETTA